jgi:hypothetical protein
MANADGTNSYKKRKDAAQDSSDGTVKTAAHPFDFQEGGLSDVVLRSSDGVDFFAQMATLSLSSPVFGGLFCIPTPVTTSPDRDSIRNGFPVVRLSETSRTLDSVLRFIYPIPPPDNLTFQEIADVLGALDKYCLTGILHRVQPLLASLLDDNPIGVYAVSIANKIYDLAGDAAIRTLKIPLERLVLINIYQIPIKDYNRLLAFHYKADDLIQFIVYSTSWFSTLRGLYESSTVAHACSSCYDSDTYDGWVMHRSLRLLILHCASSRFFYRDMKALYNYYEHISMFYSCKKCNKDCARIEAKKFIGLLDYAVTKALKKV